MTTFPGLLRASLAHCNSRGKQLAIAVLVFGCISIALWGCAWRIAMSEGMRQLQTVLGPAATADIEQRMASIGSQTDLQNLVDSVITQVGQKIGALPQDQQITMMTGMLEQFAQRALPWLAAIGIVWGLLHLWYWSYVLVLGAGSQSPWWPMAVEGLRVLPKLVLLWILILCMTVLWFVVLGGIVAVFSPTAALVVFLIGVICAVYLGLRLSLATPILVQDRQGVMESIRKSFAATKGKLFRIFCYLVGVAAVLWICTTLAQVFLSLLVSVAFPFSPYAIFLNQIMVFAMLIATAYKWVFLVRLKQEITGK